MTLKLTYENLLYLALGLVSIFIIYKLFKNEQAEYDDMNEGFQGVISRFKNASGSKSILKKGSSKSQQRKKISKKSKVSFDDIVAEAEEMDPSRYTVDSVKNNFFNYLESFNKAKFKNVSGTTDEALEKFSFFKDKFFDIFK
jgi:hypothetical protein